MYGYTVTWTLGRHQGTITASGFATKALALAAGLEMARSTYAAQEVGGTVDVYAGRAA